MNPPSSALSDAFAYLTAMMTSEAPLFAATGIRLFDYFAVILVAWFGVQWALAGGMAMDRFAALMMKIAFGFAMMHFYIVPDSGLWCDVPPPDCR